MVDMLISILVLSCRKMLVKQLDRGQIKEEGNSFVHDRFDEPLLIASAIRHSVHHVGKQEHGQDIANIIAKLTEGKKDTLGMSQLCACVTIEQPDDKADFI